MNANQMSLSSRNLFVALAAAVCCSGLATAEIQLRVSFKVILGPNGEWPDVSDNVPNNSTIGVTGVNLNSEQAVRDNIAFTNDLLAARGEAFRLQLHQNTVFTVTGQSNPWYTLPARSGTNKNDLEAAATASAAAKTTFSWHDNCINVYLNDSRSGVCSFSSTGIRTIYIGAGAYQELLLHEIGHFFDLPHTHTTDNDSDLDDWADGDGFSETLADEADADAADINARYPGETQAKRDDLIFNVMSYHLPQDRFVWQQRQEVIETVNDERDAQAIGEGFFVRDDGVDLFNGKTYGTRVRTLQRAVDLSTSSRDVILIRGTQDVTNGAVFSKPQVWMKWRSDAVIK